MAGNDQGQRDYAVSSLLGTFTLVDAVIADTLARAANEPDVRRRLRLLRRLRDELVQIVPQLVETGRQWASTMLGSLYSAGTNTGPLSADDMAVVEQLEREFTDRLAAATAHVVADSRRLVTAARSQKAFDRVLFGTTRVIGSELRAEFSSRGISAVIYRNGARHTLRDYLDALARTAVVTASNTGVVNSGLRDGIEYFEIADGAGCGVSSHDSLPKANGMVVSAAEALANPLAHPRCSRSLYPRPDVKTSKQAKRADPLYAEDIPDQMAPPLVRSPFRQRALMRNS